MDRNVACLAAVVLTLLAAVNAQTGTLPEGQLCTTAASCSSGNCVPKAGTPNVEPLVGLCGPPIQLNALDTCLSNDECKSGNCVPVAGQSICVPKEVLGLPCTSDTICMSGRCLADNTGNKVCTALEIGQACVDGEACKSTHCEFVKKQCVECDFARNVNGDCATWQYCSSDTYSCQELLPVDTECKYPSQCKSGYCVYKETQKNAGMMFCSDSPPGNPLTIPKPGIKPWGRRLHA